MRRLLPIVIGILSVVAFLPALGGEFLTWDDDVNFLTNESYRGLGWAQIRWAFSNVRMGHYIPLAWLTLSGNYVVGGMNPWGYHLVSLLLHGANAMLFYLVARRLLAAARDEGRQAAHRDALAVAGAAAAALVFALHPLRVESVAWITERRDVLSGLFFLAAILAYLRGVEAGQGIEPRWRTYSLVLFGAAIAVQGVGDDPARRPGAARRVPTPTRRVHVAPARRREGRVLGAGPGRRGGGADRPASVRAAHHAVRRLRPGSPRGDGGL